MSVLIVFAHPEPASFSAALKDRAVTTLLLRFPVWGFGMPAMMKGWVDRVFSRGFGYAAGRKYDRGHFKGKRAMLYLTTGTASTAICCTCSGRSTTACWPIRGSP